MSCGLYVHIPFCIKKCNYCDFYSVANPNIFLKFTAELIKELQSVAKRYPNTVIDTVYFGGGTPSVLPISQLKQIMDTIREAFICDFQEVTIEVNPSSSDYLEDYKGLGITRVSVGVQSLNDSVLKKLGRLHNSEQALNTLKRAKSVGYDVTADVMLGVEGSGQADVKETIEGVLPYVSHISSYILKVEENTPLYKAVKNGVTVLPTDDFTADLYTYAVDLLENNGFMRYEISNFAFNGKKSIHNLKYWQMKDYIGVGPSAHSFISGIRYENAADIKNYILGHHSGNKEETAEESSSIMGAEEFLMLGLRLTDGVSVSEIKDKFNVDVLTKYAAKLNKLKYCLDCSSDRIAIKKDYFLLQNSVLTELFK